MDSQSDKEYAAYLTRASFFGARVLGDAGRVRVLRQNATNATNGTNECMMEACRQGDADNGKLQMADG